MKTIIILIACSALSISAFSQDLKKDNRKNQEPEKEGQYCLGLKDGLAVLMKDGVAVIDDVVFNDGTKVTRQGMIINKDGTEKILKDGECVNTSVNVAKAEVLKPKK
jgi:hypothetical protein